MRPLTLAGLIALALLGLFAGLAAGSAWTAGPAAGADQALVVTTTQDELTPDGDCSLREAVQAANTRTSVDACGLDGGFDVILLPSGVYTLTLVGAGDDANATGDLDITGAVTLRSTGASAPVVSGGGTDRVLDVQAGATVRVMGVVITNGRAPDGGDGPDGPTPGAPGGGIRNAGTLTLIDVTVTGNSAGWGGRQVTIEAYTATGDGGDGGGIANSGALTLIRTRVTGNTTGSSPASYVDGAGLPGEGGGIANTGVLTLTWSTIAGNRALAGGITAFPPPVVSPYPREDPGAGGVGGGVYNAGRLTVDHSLIHGNTAAAANGGGDGRHSACGPGGAGGGIYNRRDVVVVNSTISGNHAGEASYYYCERGGGGIFNEGRMLTLDHATVTGNVTDGYDVGMGEGIGFGAGINGRATLRSTIVAGNSTWSDAYAPDCYGAVTLAGHNLVANLSGCTLTETAGGNVLGQAAHLLDLADNGGPTLTHALDPSSPAIDRGSCTDRLGQPVGSDQRGVARPLGKACDIGAFESPYARAAAKTYLPFTAR